jgi:polysaccharide biosynthesis/export protein
VKAFTGFPILLLCAAITALSGCGRPALAGPQAQAARSLAADVGDYQLGVGDKVRITVYNEDSLSGEFQVSAAGTIAMPLIGEVPASEQTPSQVSTVIQQRLAEYLRTPSVSLEVVTYRPFYILGEIRTPGQYPYANGLTVLNAIATASGFTPRANKSMVFIRRSGAETEEPFRLTPDLRVYPGDTLRITERFF